MQASVNGLQQQAARRALWKGCLQCQQNEYYFYGLSFTAKYHSAMISGNSHMSAGSIAANSGHAINQATLPLVFPPYSLHQVRTIELPWDRRLMEGLMPDSATKGALWSMKHGYWLRRLRKDLRDARAAHASKKPLYLKAEQREDLGPQRNQLYSQMYDHTIDQRRSHAIDRIMRYVPSRIYRQYVQVRDSLPKYNKLQKLRLKVQIQKDSEKYTRRIKYIPNMRPNGIIMEHYNAVTPLHGQDTLDDPIPTKYTAQYPWEVTQWGVHRFNEKSNEYYFKDPAKSMEFLKEMPARIIRNWSLRVPDARNLLPPKEFQSLINNPFEPLQHVDQIRWPQQYQVIGSLASTYPEPKKQVFAIIEAGCKQYKVTPNDYIMINRYRDVDLNDVLSLNRVLLLGSKHQTIIGRPYVPAARVIAVVEEQTRDSDFIYYWRRRNTRRSKSKLIREALTGLRIVDIVGIDEVPAHVHESGQYTFQLPDQQLPDASEDETTQEMQNQ